VLENGTKAAAGKLTDLAERGLDKIVRAGNFSGCHSSGEMGLEAWMTRAERALLFRFRAAGRAVDGQDVPQREFFSLHINHYLISPAASDGQLCSFNVSLDSVRPNRETDLGEWKPA
jgi:hypothetical protein